MAKLLRNARFAERRQILPLYFRTDRPVCEPIKATALVYDIRTIPPGKENKQDAIAVALDHRDNYSVIVIFPYSFTSDGELAIEEPLAIAGTGIALPNPEPDE